jgi:hypothetical protein
MLREDAIDLNDSESLMNEYIRLLRNVLIASRAHRAIVNRLSDGSLSDSAAEPGLLTIAVAAVNADTILRKAIEQVDAFEQRVGDAMLARDAAASGPPSLGDLMPKSRLYSATSPDQQRGIVVSVEDRRKRTDAIENMLIAGISQSRIERVCREQFGMTKAAVGTYIVRIRDRWAVEERESRPFYKAQAMRRLYGHMAEARRDKNWAAIAQFEKLLSDMQGTKEPVEVNINVDATVTEAALHVVSTLTPERRAALIEEQRRLRQLAAKQTIDTVGVPSETDSAPAND